eukprot:668297-Lingulodinium_polyedra.AAC.1
MQEAFETMPKCERWFTIELRVLGVSEVDGGSTSRPCVAASDSAACVLAPLAAVSAELLLEASGLPP